MKNKIKFIKPSSPTLSDPMDCSPPGSFVCGIFLARVLEWVAIFHSRRSSDPGIKPTSLDSPALQADYLLSGRRNDLNVLRTWWGLRTHKVGRNLY